MSCSVQLEKQATFKITINFPSCMFTADYWKSFHPLAAFVELKAAYVGNIFPLQLQKQASLHCTSLQNTRENLVHFQEYI